MDSFLRSRILYGQDLQEKLCKAKVMVCGLGAVGSFAVEALARLGVGNFILCDFDKVEITNINRQLYALNSTLEKSKAELAKQRVLDINPNAEIEIFTDFIDEENLDYLVGKSPDIVVDAIDSLKSKAGLICAFDKANIQIVSSMGAARKTDLDKIMVGDIFNTKYCPMASSLRKLLRGRGFCRKLKCVYSQENVSKDSHIYEQNTKILGSSILITGIFGLRLADLVLAYFKDDGK